MRVFLIAAAALVLAGTASAASPWQAWQVSGHLYATHSFRLYDATQQEWSWAQAAQVPMPNAKVDIVAGNPETIISAFGTYVLVVLPKASALTTQGLFLHELGHVYDLADMTPARREAFKAAIGVSNCGWWTECKTIRWVTSSTTVVSLPPGEMFAEEYAACALGLTQRGYQDAGYYSYGWVPPQGVSDSTLCGIIDGT